MRLMKHPKIPKPTLLDVAKSYIEKEKISNSIKSVEHPDNRHPGFIYLEGERKE